MNDKAAGYREVGRAGIRRHVLRKKLTVSAHSGRAGRSRP
jgi:hypothetical protein